MSGRSALAPAPLISLTAYVGPFTFAVLFGKIIQAAALAFVSGYLSRRQAATCLDFPFFPPLDKLQFSRLLFRTFRCGHSARWRTVIVSPSWVGHVDADDVAPYQSWLIADALSMALDEKPSMYPTCSTMETAILVALPQTLAPPRR